MKTIFKSKTFWINLIVGLVAMLAIVTPLFDTLVEDIEVRAKLAEIIVFVQGLLNIVLRVFFTKEPIKL